MNHEYLITINKTFFTVYIDSPTARRLMGDFLKRFNTYRLIYDYKKRKKVRQLDRNYSGGNRNLKEYRFNITFIKDFMWLLRTYKIDKDQIEVVKEDDFKSNRLNINLKSNYTLRDYQELAFNKLIDNNYSPTKLINHQTGKGKTLMSIAAACELNKATAIIILPKYIPKWISDIKELTDATDDDIVVIRGSKDFIMAMETAASGEYIPKFMIFSNRTIYLYLKAYEAISNIDEFLYPIIPTNLMETFGIGTILVDEVHQEFYSVYKASLYFAVENFIGMSATLETDDPNTEKFYRALFPNPSRLADLAYDRYVDIHAVQYAIERPKRIYAMNNMGYNHIKFEQSVMRDNRTLANYIEMIKFYVKKGYLDRKKKGDKIIIFAASIEFCSLLTELFKSIYTDLDVRRYVEDDPYENIMNADFIITTVLSAGTALDVSGLITVIQTIAMKSRQANLQSLGRLRKKEGKRMEFYYFFSKEIEKQYEYHKSRLELFRGRAKELYIEEYKKPI